MCPSNFVHQAGRGFWLSIATMLALLSGSVSAEVSQKGLADIIKKAIQEESVLYDPPRVSVTDQELNYSPGRILYPDYANEPARAWGFPVEVQFRTELIRKFRADEAEEMSVLKPYLAKLDAVVSKELALIAKHDGSQEELVGQLTEMNNQAKEILRTGIASWAEKQGWTVAEESFQAAVIPTVQIRTVPEGATVYYLNAVDYNVYKSAGVLSDIDKWNQIAAEQIDMGGTFYFRAVWPDGRMKQTARVLIDKEQTISLRAE